MGKRVEVDLLTYSHGGFPSLARVAKQYQVADGMLRGVGSGIARTYLPFSEEGLPDAFARISSGEIKPLEFAAEYGELGFSRLVRRKLLPDFSACLPKTDEWQAAHGAYRQYRDAAFAAARNLPDGDPLEWLMGHSRTAAFCIQFIGLLEDGDAVAIREELESIPAHKPFARRDQLFRLPVRDWRESLKRQPASVVIRPQLHHIINENIAGVRREFITDPFCLRTDSFFFGTTIEAVYWQLADKMESKMVRRCEECKRFFVARDKRQTYCPALPGSTRSRCSARKNVRNFRDRQV